MKSIFTLMALIGAAVALPMAATAQDDAATEEIVVVSKKSLNQLRREVFRSEEDFYKLFNQLNDESDYDVRCFYETPTGTRQKNHVCRAKFVSEAYGSHAAQNGGDLSRIANQDANPVLAQKVARFEEIMATLVGSNPDLEAALIRYNTARADFMAKREALGRD